MVGSPLTPLHSHHAPAEGVQLAGIAMGVDVLIVLACMTHMQERVPKVAFLALSS